MSAVGDMLDAHIELRRPDPLSVRNRQAWRDREHAQGEQASEPRHADGYIFTGPDPRPSVQTPEDAVRHFGPECLMSCIGS